MKTYIVYTYNIFIIFFTSKLYDEIVAFDIHEGYKICFLLK